MLMVKQEKQASYFCDSVRTAVTGIGLRFVRCALVVVDTSCTLVLRIGKCMFSPESRVLSGT